MAKLLVWMAAPALLLASPASAQGGDGALRDTLIQQSRAAYPGRCPCPYSVMRNGMSCGARSAWSRPGGRAPLCYRRDISDQMLAAQRGRSMRLAQTPIALRGRLP